MLVDKTIVAFTDELASNSPAPGGGSISALAGSLGAALTAMVCRLTMGNEKYDSAQDEVKEILGKADNLMQMLTKYIDEDTKAFNKVMGAYRLPKDTDEQKNVRSQAIQQAMENAASLPLKVAECCLEIIKMAQRALVIGNANAASDAAVSGLMAYAGLNGALYNVRINLPSIKDKQFVDHGRAKVNLIKLQADSAYVELTATADKVIG